MNALKRLLGTAAIVGVISGCSASVDLAQPGGDAPACTVPARGQPKEFNGTLVLTAQSVPTASRIPCLRRLPAGWAFRSFSARSGEARVALDVGRADDNALVITLTRTCDIRTAARTRSDRTGLLRYEDVHRSARDFTGQRYYLFPGGCLTLSFDVRGEAAAATASMIARSVSVIKRADLREHVRLYSRGRFYLDPTPRS